MNHIVQFSATEAPLFETKTFPERVKSAMIFEGGLIAGNIKVFLGAALVALMGTADIVADSSSWEEKTVQGILVGTIVFLFRQLAIERKENKETEKKLWEKLLKDRKDDDDDDSRPKRHTR